VGNLASLSLYRMVLMDDGETFNRERLAGCMVQEWGTAFGRDGNAWIGALNVSGMAKRIVPNPDDGSSAPTSTEFPAPADSDYPVSPYVLSHAATATGSVKIGSERNAYLIGFRLTGRNILTPLRNASRFPSGFLYLGRQVTLEADIRLKASPDDREAWREITSQDTEVILDDGTTILTIDMHGSARIDNWQRQTPQQDEYSATLTVVNRHDNTAGTDLTITVAEA
jgi:hypothetical protein